MTEQTLAAKQKTKARDIVLCGLLAALIAIGAFIRIPMGPIAFSMQTMFVSLAGMLLGKKLGVTAILVYIAIGLAGLPIFTKGGGFTYVLEPSFGFLPGFLFYTWMTAHFTGKLTSPGMPAMILAQLPGLFTMYAIALPYFYLISQFYLQNDMGVYTLMTSCFLFLMPGEAMKCILAAWLGKRLIPVLRQGGK